MNCTFVSVFDFNITLISLSSLKKKCFENRGDCEHISHLFTFKQSCLYKSPVLPRYTTPRWIVSLSMPFKEGFISQISIKPQPDIDFCIFVCVFMLTQGRGLPAESRIVFVCRVREVWFWLNCSLSSSGQKPSFHYRFTQNLSNKFELSIKHSCERFAFPLSWVIPRRMEAVDVLNVGRFLSIATTAHAVVELSPLLQTFLFSCGLFEFSIISSVIFAVTSGYRCDF